MELTWQLIPFAELSTEQLYRLIQMRIEIFVVEQYCPYQDLDDKDLKSWHLLGFLGNELVAYARVMPPGVSYPEASIGRIITSHQHRREGFGKILVQKALEAVDNLFGTNSPVRITAQQYLQRFYLSFGFELTGKEYLEDGIPHIELLRKP